MTGGAVIRAAGGGAARRRVQTLVIFLVLAVGAAAGTLGLTLSTNSNAAFLGEFATRHGPHLAVTVNSAKVTSAELARTSRLPEVTRAAGPYPETTIAMSLVSKAGAKPKPSGGIRSRQQNGHQQLNAPVPAQSPGSTPNGQGPGGAPTQVPGGPTQRPVSSAPGQRPSSAAGQGSGSATGQGPGSSATRAPAAGGAAPGEGVTVIGRASMGGPLDQLLSVGGRWATRPGEIVLAPTGPFPYPIGSTVKVTSAPGQPELTVVGWADTNDPSADAWVGPSEVAALRAKGAPAQEEMLYTFAHASTAKEISVDLAEIKAALPAGAVASSQSWLATDSLIAAEQGVNTPFSVAYALIALVLAVLITASVVAAAVVASYRRIGVLKSVGFTPAQVAATCVAQLGIPAIAGVVIGTLVGNWWVLPLLNGSEFTVSVPLWINITVPLGMLVLTGVGALVPALRAGRLPAVAAIAAGQAPRAGHGYAAHRLAAKLRLPRPVTMGLAAPFTRPSRSAVTLATLTFGLTAVVLAVGLNTSIAKINSAARQYGNKEIIIPPSGPAGKFTPSQERAVAAALGAQPDTQSYVAQVSATGSVPGLGQHVPVTAYRGNAAGLGWQMVSGRWYHAPGEAVINAAYPTAASLSAGQSVRLTVSGKPVTVRITGEAFVPGRANAVFIGWQTLAGNGISLAADRYIAVARPGVSAQAYQAALDKALGPGYRALSFVPGQNGGVGGFALVDTSLIRLLTLLVAVLAGLGVLNTVLMSTRERVHDLGVVKALGMTPRQTIAMVTCWILAPAVGAAIIGLPAGMSLQNTIINAIGRGQTATGTLSIPPGSLVHVYTPGGLALLALAGLAIAIIGALGPATWAAVTSTTTALRAE